MECNKEEAVRAKEIAESKMVIKDFTAARKIALKAQRLYEDLENISQMLMVCDVHCAAEKKVFGSERDWYGILQVDPTADDATIKKQYKKLALQLHPDKNKFPGAGAAFQLIGEAQRVLLDKVQRSLYDVRQRASTNKPAPPYRSHQPQRPNQNSAFGFQNNINTNFTGFKPQHHQQQQQQQQSASQQGSTNGRATFWTACPFCSVKYQYYIEIINKSIICQSCIKPFNAYERSVPDGSASSRFTQPVFPRRTDIPNQGTSKVDLGQRRNTKVEPPKTESFRRKGSSSEFVSERANHRKRKKQESESSESIDTESSTDSEAELEVDQDGDFKSGQRFCSTAESVRRSDRHKRKVSYKENVSDDEDFASSSKKTKGSKSSHAREEENENQLKEDASTLNYSGLHGDVKDQSENPKAQDVKGKAKVEENGSGNKAYNIDLDATTDASSDSILNPEPDLYVYPDPEFKDFDKDRNEECFSVGQIWAVYDTLDAMPRFYARIRKVFTPGFRVQITWLEPDPDDQNKIEWVNEGLPASCGKFKHGQTENTEDRLMFSHLVNWEKGSRRDTYKIVPRKGEVWAIFKNWDIKWKSDVSSNQEYDFEFVELLSEYTEGVGASVAYLSKVKGFVSLFCRIKRGGRDTFLITPDELFRFSHMVPSFKLTGNERDTVPKGSFELDPASLPKIIEEIDIPGDSKGYDGSAELNSSSSKSADQTDVKSPGPEPEDEDNDVEGNCSASQASIPGAIECPDPEFFNFDSNRSNDKFQVGQIWALYCDEDGLPKYYCEIVKVDSQQSFKLQIRWLTSYFLPNDVVQWQDESMPICCGTFKLKKSSLESYSSTDAFSHRIAAEPAGKKNIYVIMPRKGEVWALYRNWSSKMKCSELENYEYDMVEVIELNELWIKVNLLERVAGFNSVFKAQVKEGWKSVTVQVPRAELLRFSHQIPAFQLTDERDGSLRGFWELDPAALPLKFFATN